MNKYFISGMFRSSTTMIARMLHANPNIVCASDPFAPIFKSFRNMVCNEILSSFDPDSPLHDYYFDTRQNRIYHTIQNWWRFSILG